MHVKELSDGFLVRLENGEEIRAGLAELMQRYGIGSGFVTGLGAIMDPEMGYYVLDEKRYVTRSLEGEYELVGLTGTLSWFDGDPFPHIHTMLTGPDFLALGGHCFEATASATVEMLVRSTRDRVDRSMDERIGLHLMQLPESCPIRPFDG